MVFPFSCFYLNKVIIVHFNTVPCSVGRDHERTGVRTTRTVSM